ncbi:hypothetical protein HDU87_003267 [Geranomyces variabilis]|uniref:Uncharacterized protein n=1 Tax=Geranomyces variabilis TaxID=109894 RepID=A0AAD5XRK1_9FUNG|nr:hypothetical protein HDU87_003267 [Geranomyces variabilis]
MSSEGGGSVGNPVQDKPPAKRRGRPPNSAKETAIIQLAVNEPATPRAMKSLLAAVRAARDRGGRHYAALFETLPHKAEYPDYYALIKKPIALVHIQQKAEKGQYESLGDLIADFELLVENAKAYNRRGSTVYKDALAMHTAFSTEIARQRNIPPPVSQTPRPRHVNNATNNTPEQEQMHKILTALLEREDEEYGPRIEKDDAARFTAVLTSELSCSGRLLSEMFTELPDKEEYPDYYDEIKAPITLEIISQKLSSGAYHALEEFESDFSLMIANALEYNQEGSEVYDDALALQKVFNELVKSEPQASATGEAMVPQDTLLHKGEMFEPGDFVYIFNPNDPHKPTVAQITLIWSNAKRTGIKTCWFLRPEQTVYRANTKFYQNEVFKTNHHETYQADEIVGRCHVLHIKDYSRGRPKNALAKDVFVCESRYNEQAKQYAKIRNWATCMPASARPGKAVPELELFPTPLTPAKIYPAFAASAAAAVVQPAAVVLPGKVFPGGAAVESKIASSYITPLASGAASERLFPVVAGPSAATTPAFSAHSAHSSGYLPATVPVLAPPFGTPAAAAIATPVSKPAYTAYKAPSSIVSSGAYSNTGPGYIPLPLATAESFEATEERRVKWFAAPPLDVVDEWTAVHSLEYLYTRAVEKRKANEFDDPYADYAAAATTPATSALASNAGSGKRLKKMQIEMQKANAAAAVAAAAAAASTSPITTTAAAAAVGGTPPSADPPQAMALHKEQQHAPASGAVEPPNPALRPSFVPSPAPQSSAQAGFDGHAAIGDNNAHHQDQNQPQHNNPQEVAVVDQDPVFARAAVADALAGK